MRTFTTLNTQEVQNYQFPFIFIYVPSTTALQIIKVPIQLNIIDFSLLPVEYVVNNHYP